MNKSKTKLNALAERLLDKEVIFKDDLERILGRRPFDKDTEEPQPIRKTEKTTAKKPSE